MKSCYCTPQIDIPSYCGVASKGQIRRYHHALLGMSLFLIVCWVLCAIWLINLRRSERSVEEVLERQAIVSHVLRAETPARR